MGLNFLKYYWKKVTVCPELGLNVLDKLYAYASEKKGKLVHGNAILTKG